MVEYGIALSGTSGGSSRGLDLPGWVSGVGSSSTGLLIVGGICALLLVLMVVR